MQLFVCCFLLLCSLVSAATTTAATKSSCTYVNDIANTIKSAGDDSALAKAYAITNQAIIRLTDETSAFTTNQGSIDLRLELIAQNIQQRIYDGLPWDDLNVQLQQTLQNKTSTERTWQQRQQTLQSDISRYNWNLQQQKDAVSQKYANVIKLRRQMLGATSSRLSTGVEHSCAIITDDSLVCWGRGDLKQTTVPSGKFKEVSVGDYVTCAIDLQDQISCFGSSVYGRIAAPTGRFKQIAVGGGHSCALRVNDSMAVCWGWNEYGQCDAPTDVALQSLCTGFSHSCGVDVNGKIRCWGSNGNDRSNPPSSASSRLFSAITCGVSHTCAVTGEFPDVDPVKFGLRRGQDMLCWGDAQYGKTSPPATVLWQPPVLSAGFNHTCGMDAGNQIVCFGNIATPPSGRYSAISSSWGYACASTLNGGLPICWGDSTDSWGRTKFPSNTILCSLPQT